LPKDNKEVMLRFAGIMGRLVPAGLGGEEREDFLGGKSEDSILLGGLDGAFDYSLTDLSSAVGLQAWTSHRRRVIGSSGLNRR
jgi:hypothetical protein